MTAPRYNRKRIAWELERTAMGDGYYGNALRVAKDFPEATPIVRSLLDRWATGKQSGLSDQTDLCAFALQVYSADGESPSAPVGVRCNRPNVACAWPDCGRDCRHLVQQPAAVASAAEIEALRADAERYRWLRAQDVIAVTSHDQSASYQRDDLDAEVDRARGKEEGKA